MKRVSILLAALLTACATTQQPTALEPRDLLLVVDQEGNKLLLQSVVTNCQAPWRRAIHTNATGHQMIGCWRKDAVGNLVVDYEDGKRAVVPAEQLRPMRHDQPERMT